VTGRTTGPSLTVCQVRSGIGFDKTQKATLKALGLGRIGKRRALPDNDQVRGMIAKVCHLVEVEQAGERTKA
jgi:large subunit ribosomal protein L30